MRLTSISTVGFKSEDIDYVLGDAAAFIGENETNKSQVLHAIDLVFSGHVDSDSIVTQGKTGDAVLTYARDEYKGITIEASGDYNGRIFRVVRSWKREHDGKVTQYIDQNIDPGVTGLRDQQKLLVGLLPPAPKWDIKELLNASPAEARKRILALIVTDVSAESICPPKIPDAYLPEPSESGLAWVSRALALVSRDIAVRLNEAKAARAEVEALSDAWRPRDEDPPTERLEKAREALKASEDWHRKEERKAEILASMEKLSGKLPPDWRAVYYPLKTGAEGAEAEALRALEAARSKLYQAQREHKPKMCETCGQEIPTEGGDEWPDPALLEAVMQAEKAHERAMEASDGFRRAVLGMQQLADQLDRLQADLALVDAELEGNPGLDYEALFAEHDAAVAEVSAHKAYMLRHEEYREASVNEVEAKGKVTALTAWKEAIQTAQNKVIEHGRPAFEKALSDVVGKPVRLQLDDARGNPTLSFLVGGVDASALSDGTSIQFVAAFQIAVAKSLPGFYRLLRVDRLESISKTRRAPFLRKLLMAVRAGVVDQVIVAGCPDELDAPEGLAVVRC